MPRGDRNSSDRLDADIDEAHTCLPVLKRALKQYEIAPLVCASLVHKNSLDFLSAIRAVHKTCETTHSSGHGASDGDTNCSDVIRRDFDGWAAGHDIPYSLQKQAESFALLHKMTGQSIFEDVCEMKARRQHATSSGFVWLPSSQQSSDAYSAPGTVHLRVEGSDLQPINKHDLLQSLTPMLRKLVGMTEHVLFNVFETPTHDITQREHQILKESQERMDYDPSLRSMVFDGDEKAGVICLLRGQTVGTSTWESYKATCENFRYDDVASTLKSLQPKHSSAPANEESWIVV